MEFVGGKEISKKEEKLMVCENQMTSSSNRPEMMMIKNALTMCPLRRKADKLHYKIYIFYGMVG